MVSGKSLASGFLSMSDPLLKVAFLLFTKEKGDDFLQSTVQSAGLQGCPLRRRCLLRGWGKEGRVDKELGHKA